MASLKVVVAVAACFAVLVLLNDVAVGVGAEACDDCKKSCNSGCTEPAKWGCGGPEGRCAVGKENTDDCVACREDKKVECEKSCYELKCVKLQNVCPATGSGDASP